MKHFLTISKLRPDVKNKLTKGYRHTGIDPHRVLPRLLYIKGQGNFEQFREKFSILTFSFVRHPFARFVIRLTLESKKGYLVACYFFSQDNISI